MTTSKTTGQLFELGNVYMTPGAKQALENAGLPPETYLRRHAVGDFGNLFLADVRTNQAAVRDGTRILSAYNLPTKVKLWIITENDRSATTLLLPQEY